jgi:hypothetical protein
MKPLVFTLVLLIMVISLSGCVVVSSYGRGHVRHEVFVCEPPHIVIGPLCPPPPPPRPHHAPRPHHPRFRHMLP